MGKYLSPPNPTDYETRCAIVYYPADSGAFYLQAIRGQLSALARPWVWEGDIETAATIADIWLQHDIMTDGAFFNLDCEDVPIIIGEDDLNITVNSNCNSCCGDGGGGVGDLVVTIVNNPIGQPYGPLPAGYDDILDIDGNPQGPAADIYPTAAAYDAAACELANAMYEDVYVWLQRLESAFDVLFLIGDIVQFLLGVGVVKETVEKIGRSWLADLAKETAEFVAKEWATTGLVNGVLAYLDANKQTIICGLYDNRDNLNAMADSLVGSVVAGWLDAAGNNSLTAEETTLAQEFARRTTRILTTPVRLYEWITGNLPRESSSPIDCLVCSQSPSGVIINFNDAIGGEGVNFSDGEELLINKEYIGECQFENAASGDYELWWAQFRYINTTDAAPVELSKLEITGWQAGTNAQGLDINDALLDATPDGDYAPLSNVTTVEVRSALNSVCQIKFIISAVN